MRVRPSTMTAMVMTLTLVMGSGRTGLSQETTGGTGEESTTAERRSELTAQQKEDFAKFVQAAQDAYQEGEFDRAIPFLERAHEIIPKPALHFRIALCYERSDQPRKALEYYRKFLEEKPDSSRRGAVEETISQLEARLEKASKATVEVVTNPSGVKVSVRRLEAGGERGEEARGRTPLTMQTVGGKLEITLQKEGYRTLTRTVEATAGERQSFSFRLQEATPHAAPSSSRRPRGAAVALLVVGGIGVVGGGALYGVGLHCRGVSAAQKNCSRGLFNASVYGSYVAGGVGLAGLGTAALLWLTGDRKAKASQSDATAVPIRAVVSPGGVGIVGRFR